MPKKLVFTTLGCAIAGAVACSGQPSGGESDASVGYDAPPTDCEGGSFTLCGGGPCPSDGLYYCGLGCPTGCEPYS